MATFQWLDRWLIIRLYSLLQSRFDYKLPVRLPRARKCPQLASFVNWAFEDCTRYGWEMNFPQWRENAAFIWVCFAGLQGVLSPRHPLFGNLFSRLCEHETEVCRR